MQAQELYLQASELHQQNQLAAAAAAYAEALKREPRHAASLHGLGVVTFQLHGEAQVAKAIDLVRQAVNAAPPVARYRHSLGVLQEKAGQLLSAADCLERACEKDPTNVRYHLDHARVLKALERPARAAEVFRHIRTALDPTHATVHYKEACAWRLAGRKEHAAAAFKRHLELQPDHQQARFWYAALTGSSAVAACPADMVAGLFDGYADHFDHHLVHKLGYRTPELLMDLLHSVAGSTAQFRRCLDLGCGTGLMGPLLRSSVQHLAGVDLSAGMVEKARERGCYDELAVGELVAYLRGCQRSPASPVDLLVAADVFVYIGDLRPVMEAAEDCSAAGAMFLFSTEALEADTCPPSTSSSSSSPPPATATPTPSPSSCARATTPANNDGFCLQATGRYTHSAQYLQGLCQQTRWRMVAVKERVVLRHNAGRPVQGNLCIMQLS